MSDITEASIRERLAEFYEPDEIEVWMTSPQVLLEGARACDLIRDGQIERVDRVLRQLEDGVYL